LTALSHPDTLAAVRSAAFRPCLFSTGRAFPLSLGERVRVSVPGAPSAQERVP